MVWVVKIEEEFFEGVKEHYFKDKMNAIKFILLQLTEGLEPGDFEFYEIKEGIYSDGLVEKEIINYDKLKKGIVKKWEDDSKKEILIETIKKLNLSEKELKELGIFKEFIVNQL